MTRIIAGDARGRTIKVPESGTRPTSDRAREGLFSSLDVRWGFNASRGHWGWKQPAVAPRRSCWWNIALQR